MQTACFRKCTEKSCTRIKLHLSFVSVIINKSFRLEDIPPETVSYTHLDVYKRQVTWLDAGTRNFYTVDTPIETPADLKGLKIRVQQSPTNVQMMSLLGGSATPMGFGDVYTALQSKIIDGAENNELALTDNGHGDVCKYYSYEDVYKRQFRTRTSDWLIFFILMLIIRPPNL